jgi:hypothetical protein
MSGYPGTKLSRNLGCPSGMSLCSHMWNWHRYVSKVMQPSQPYSRKDQMRSLGVILRTTMKRVSGIQLV